MTPWFFEFTLPLGGDRIRTGGLAFSPARPMASALALFTWSRAPGSSLRLRSPISLLPGRGFVIATLTWAVRLDRVRRYDATLDGLRQSGSRRRWHAAQATKSSRARSGEFTDSLQPASP